ncbi:lysylphosphatidylglycerol synthase transmembrane domain-containing protein [Mesorhizobium sp. NBSH29]|uniref:lysylphosphatidylglycerol synthase transmembrane domain-containing protein n=1 Tax=Mesorhizobium sp. NBSH29 TaxID=2654249 RepID=UPI0018966F4F|nr:YbhN family protein [Mesorhizobium sp. NBSH29]
MAARIGGIAISLVALAFVARSIHRSFAALQQQLVSPLFLAAIFACAIAYAIALLLIGVGWHRLVAAVDGQKSIKLGHALAIFARTQIYKYFPTNVMHMVGRFALGSRAGASKKALVFAQAAELVLFSTSALAVGALFASPSLREAYNLYDLPFRTAGMVVALLSLGLAIFAVAIIARGRLRHLGRAALKGGSEACLLYLLFFTVNGLLTVALAQGLGGAGHAAPIIGIASVAWLIGFIIPGAPGGLGVREAVMIAGLSSVGVPAATATAIALGNRVVTVSGDAILALVAGIIGGTKREAKGQ